MINQIHSLVNSCNGMLTMCAMEWLTITAAVRWQQVYDTAVCTQRILKSQNLPLDSIPLHK